MLTFPLSLLTYFVDIPEMVKISGVFHTLTQNPVSIGADLICMLWARLLGRISANEYCTV